MKTLKRRKITKSEIALVENAKQQILNSPSYGIFLESIKNTQKQVQNTIGSLEPMFSLLRQAVKDKNEPRYIPVTSTKVSILQELRQIKNNLVIKVNSGEAGIIYDIKANTLSREVDGNKLVCDISEIGKRKILLDILIAEGKYVKTEILRDLVGSKNNLALSKLAKVFSRKVEIDLALVDIDFIQGKKDSGYRINPKVLIARRNK